MQFDDYHSRAARIAAEVVNVAVDHPTLGVVTAALAEHDLHLDLDEGDLPAVVALAGALRPVFEATDLDGAVAVVNDLLDTTPMAPHLSTHDGRAPHIHVERPDASVAERLRANSLMGLAAVLSDGRRRLGVCDADECERVYVDTSRNARRRFCSDRCATRTHVAAHRARRARR